MTPTRTKRTEVAIVGGGPAGAAAAIELARRGRKPLVLERRRFPRFHVGESLLPQSNRLFRRLGVMEGLRAEGFVVKRGASFMTETAECRRRVDFGDSPEVGVPTTYHVPRSRFDELLLSEAAARGAIVLEETRVTGFELGRGGVRISISRGGKASSHEAEALIDASGQAGLVARRLGIRRVDRRLRNVAIHAWFEGVARPAGVRGGDIRIVSLREMGWVWLIPIDDATTSVGFVMPRSVAARSGAALKERLSRIPALEAAFAAARQVTAERRDADFSYSPIRYAGERWLLVGDAGSFIDPVFSSGVQLALESGIEAGEAVDRALARGGPKKGSFGAFDRRQKRRYRFFRRFAAGFYDPAFRDLFLSPEDRWGLQPAIVAALAGVWRPALASRVRLRLFFMLVALQRHVAIAPRLHGHGGLP